MTVVLRFLQLEPRCVPAYEATWREALASEPQPGLRGFWRTDVGAIDSMVQLWDAPEGAALPAWGGHLVQDEDVVALEPAPFSPPLAARALGAVYELRIYSYAPGSIPTVSERWQEKIEARTRMSPLVLCGHALNGRLHRWFHLWAYENALERQRIRAEVLRLGLWPPDARAGLQRQTNMLLLPSTLSPLR